MSDVDDRPQLGLQLFTLRSSGEGLLRLLPRVAALGYRGVELYGGQLADVDPDDARTVLNQVGLTVPSALAGLSAAGRFDEDELERLQAIGVEHVVVPLLWVDQFADADSVAAAAERLNGAQAQLARRGLVLGYHNHHWELTPLDDGRPALLHLFERLDPAAVAEVDLYWVHVAGVDPAALVGELGDRARLLHVKDGPGDDPSAPQVALGEGALALAAALQAASSATWHHVELDQFDGDAWAPVVASADYLSDLGLTRCGR
ncbi:MAG: sugar phosphate isomerase/epimerase [Acidimicrobiales bacterium]|nr:sugar phosphate isomerase/epimerase [Acidimicrobiales bacterium]